MQNQVVVHEEEATPLVCARCDQPAVFTCSHCEAALRGSQSYRAPTTGQVCCRTCADARWGVCDVYDALPARHCQECGRKVCQEHQRQVIARWGWGTTPGTGVTDWFPILQTYCLEHGKDRPDVPQPAMRTLTGYDGSSPEW